MTKCDQTQLLPDESSADDKLKEYDTLEQFLTDLEIPTVSPEGEMLTLLGRVTLAFGQLIT